MGEIADAMLDGTLCACCGTYIGKDAGYPLYCSEACKPDELKRCEQSGTPRRERSALPRFNRYSIPPRAGSVDCPYCAAHPKLAGLADHIKAKHPEKIEEQ